MMNYLTILMDNDSPSVVIGSNDGTAQASENTQTATVAQTAQSTAQTANTGALFGGRLSIGFFLYIMVLIAAFYFFAIRPQKKREKEIQEQQAGMQVGDDVRTSSGFYGKIVELEEDKAVVEFGTNRGVRIPVAKSELFALPKANTEEK